MHEGDSDVRMPGLGQPAIVFPQETVLQGKHRAWFATLQGLG